MSHPRNTILLVGLATLIPSCSGPNASGIPKGTSSTASATGEVVQRLGDHLWIVFQDTHGAHWFGSDGDGVYRDDGKDITRFTTQDGLCNDHIRQIQDDEAGNVYFNTCNGISKFDGQYFRTLVPIEGGTSAEAWKSKPGDLWFSGRQDDKGPYRLDGESLDRLSFPKIELEDVFNAKFPSVPYSPYVEDRDGKMWLSNTLHRYAMVPKDSTAREGRSIAYRKEKGIDRSGVKGDAGYAYFVSAIRDAQGVLWLGSTASGAYRFNGEAFERYRP